MHYCTVRISLHRGSFTAPWSARLFHATWQNVGMTENAVNTAVTSPSPAIPAVNRPLGTPLGKHPTRVLFLGAGELGKEVAIELMRLGAWVCAADSYAGAPAQQVAHEYRVLDMANAAELQVLFDEVKPDIIVPEVEAIATDMLAGAAAAGAQVVPSAEIAAICMDRERLRVLAHEELGLPTTPYRFAGSLEELRAGALEVGYPCVVKPVMSSSGHGQSVVRSANAIDAAWTEAQEGRRAADEGDVSRVIVEALAPLERELTVLTVSSSAGIVTCAPIGQRQESGDYRESWQPAAEPGGESERAQDIARTVVEGLVAKAQAAGETGWGVFGVELFVLTDGSILFNEVSPRPHDTGMVTMASQRLSEFALHARAILGLPITAEHVALTIPSGSVAASHAIVVAGDGEAEFTDVAAALAEPSTDLRIFAKPEVHGHRRMAVALAVGITTIIFDLLKKRGIDSHLVKRVNDTGQLVRKVNMFPLEIVLRNVAAGHFCSRLGVEEGLPLKEPVLEYFLKNDDLHDPFVNDDDLVALDVCTREDLAEIAPLARKINEALIEIFAKIDVKLVDFKIEMGRATDGTLLLADEITPDSCRLWDQKDHSGKVEHLDKDLFRRGLGSIIPAYEEIEERLAELAKSEGIEVAE